MALKLCLIIFPQKTHVVQSQAHLVPKYQSARLGLAVMASEKFLRDCRKVSETQPYFNQTFRTVVKLLKAFEKKKPIETSPEKWDEFRKLRLTSRAVCWFSENWIRSPEKNCLCMFSNPIHDSEKRKTELQKTFSNFYCDM